MDGAKQAPLCRLPVAIAARALNVPNAFFDGRRGTARPLEKRRQRGLGLTHDPVPPSFRVMENAPGFAVVAIQKRKRSLDRRRVDASHQLADQLLLPAQRTVTAHPLGTENGVFKPLVQVDSVELLAGQSNQPFTERLQGQVLTFFC
jgi:hypothetical protein